MELKKRQIVGFLNRLRFTRVWESIFYGELRELFLRSNPRKNTENERVIMSTNADHNYQLLNGLLDGVLTDDEQRTLEIAMKADPSLEATLSELQSMRRSLLRGRSVGRLSPDFSKGIVSEARKRAESMGDQAPEWLSPASRPADDRVGKREGGLRKPRIEQSFDFEPSAPLVMTEPSVSQRAWKVWVPVLAVATAAAILLYVSGPMFSPPSVAPLVGDRIPDKFGDPVESGGRDGQRDLLPDDPLANELAADLLAKAGGALPASDRLPPPDRPEITTPSVAVGNEGFATKGESPVGSSRDTEMKLADSRKMNSSEKGIVDQSLTSNGAGENKPSDPVKELFDAMGLKNPILTLVVEIVLDPIAEQNDTLRALLEEHEIVYADDLNISAEQLDSLVSSRMVGMMAGVDVAKRPRDVQVLFVRAKAKRINAFVLDAMKQFKDFPEIRLDVSFDPSVVQLMDQLSTIVNSEEGARRLTFAGSGDSQMVSLFPRGEGEGKFLSREGRSRLTTGVSSREETSYLMLLVRPASSENK